MEDTIYIGDPTNFESFEILSDEIIDYVTNPDVAELLNEILNNLQMLNSQFYFLLLIAVCLIFFGVIWKVFNYFF